MQYIYDHRVIDGEHLYYKKRINERYFNFISAEEYMSDKVREKVSEIIKEELSARDEDKIRDIIRQEVASIFFDLFRKRGTWV